VKKTRSICHCYATEEPDDVQFLSGILKKTVPIGFVIPNTNQKSDDYSHIKDNYRPSHADYVYEKKCSYRGGGRGSERETESRVSKCN
jgi:chorismate synthase